MEIPKDLTVDFIGVGTPKCGTEWIVACLREHPEVDFSLHKEPHVFMSLQDSKLMGRAYAINRLKTIEEYKNDFTWKEGTKKGEFSIQYIFDKKALEKTKKAFPNAKIILTIRNPVDWLYSLYWYLRFSNAYHRIPATFEEALETTNPDQPYHKNKANFGDHIKMCMDIFGRKNLLIIPLEDVKNSPEKTIKKIYSFVGIDPNYNPTMLNVHMNKTTALRFPGLSKYIDFLINTMVILKLDRLLNHAINVDCRFRRIYQKIAHTDKKYPPMSKETRKKLKREFKDQIEKVEKLLKRDFSHWK